MASVGKPEEGGFAERLMRTIKEADPLVVGQPDSGRVRAAMAAGQKATALPYLLAERFVGRSDRRAKNKNNKRPSRVGAAQPERLPPGRIKRSEIRRPQRVD